MSAQVEPSHYDWASYNTEERWTSYWHQVSNVIETPGSCLEIGPGSGIVTRTLREHGVDVTTVDIDPRLGVDRVGAVTSLPCTDGEFDVVLCSQVLEHVPWSQFSAALAELARVARRRVVVSLPQSGRGIRLHLELTPHRPLSLVLRTPARGTITFDGQHYWEVGVRGSRARDVRREIRRHFSIDREYVVPGNLYHRFYVLSPLKF